MAKLFEANWFDLFKNFSNSFTEPPIAVANNVQNLSGAGISGIDALSVRDMNSLSNNRFVAIRGADELVDVSLAAQSRNTRYQELERLRVMVEIESALSIYANEACVNEHTKIWTPFGTNTIGQLAKEKNSEERFLVYCYSFKKQDFTLGWAYNPRFVKRAWTLRVVLSNGEVMHVTEDHRILLRDGTWRMAGDLKEQDEIMFFNRVPPIVNGKELGTSRYPRILTVKDGWQTEPIMVGSWSYGKIPEELEKEFMYNKGASFGVKKSFLMKELKICRENKIHNQIIYKDIQLLNKRYKNFVHVVGIFKYKNENVYDLSVQDHENFATTAGIMHNCQMGESGHCFDIRIKNKDAQKICEKLCHEELEMDASLWGSFRNLCLYGDEFWEAIIDPNNPKYGILKLQSLPASSMYRLETIKGRLIEFQQSGVGPDISALNNPDVENSSTGAIRFTPQQIIHLRLGGDRRMFYPYGESVLEVAKSAAYQLRLMEDAMTVYRLCLVGDTRVRTLNSYKYIKNISVGDIVYSYDKQGSTIPTKVVNSVCNGVKEVFKVKSNHVEITGTATHPILVSRNGVVQYVDVKDLIPFQDRLILTTRKKENFSKSGFIKDISDMIYDQFTADNCTYYVMRSEDKKSLDDIKEAWSSMGFCAYIIFKLEDHYDLMISDKILPETENILSVTYAGEEPVYDITVENELHNFIANGIPVHNTRSPSRRVFYVDVGSLPPHKVDALLERAKDQFRKKKVFNSRTANGLNASGVEEKWNPMSFDEDIWLAQRDGQGTKVETISETVSWSDIADIQYFRNKLLIALGLPKSYLAQEDPSLTRLSLTAQDMQFAKRLQRMQMVVAQGIRQLCSRHLELIGFPKQEYSDIKVKLTPSSDWYDISRNEIIDARHSRASAMKGSQLMSDYDILVEILKYEPDIAKELVSRMDMQKISEMKLQAMAQNPKFLGLVEPGPAENEMGVDASGPVADINTGEDQQGQQMENPPQEQASLMPEPLDDDIDKYNLGMKNYAKDKDVEDVDIGELNENYKFRFDDFVN